MPSRKGSRNIRSSIKSQKKNADCISKKKYDKDIETLVRRLEDAEDDIDALKKRVVYPTVIQPQINYVPLAVNRTYGHSDDGVKTVETIIQKEGTKGDTGRGIDKVSLSDDGANLEFHYTDNTSDNVPLPKPNVTVNFNPEFHIDDDGYLWYNNNNNIESSQFNSTKQQWTKIGKVKGEDGNTPELPTLSFSLKEGDLWVKIGNNEKNIGSVLVKPRFTINNNDLYVNVTDNKNYPQGKWDNLGRVVGEKGEQRDIDIAINNNNISWKYKDSTNWVDIISVDELKIKGDTIEPIIQIRPYGEQNKGHLFVNLTHVKDSGLEVPILDNSNLPNVGEESENGWKNLGRVQGLDGQGTVNTVDPIIAKFKKIGDFLYVNIKGEDIPDDTDIPEGENIGPIYNLGNIKGEPGNSYKTIFKFDMSNDRNPNLYYKVIPFDQSPSQHPLPNPLPEVNADEVDGWRNLGPVRSREINLRAGPNINNPTHIQWQRVGDGDNWEELVDISVLKPAFKVFGNTLYMRFDISQDQIDTVDAPTDDVNNGWIPVGRVKGTGIRRIRFNENGIVIEYDDDQVDDQEIPLSLTHRAYNMPQGNRPGFMFQIGENAIGRFRKRINYPLVAEQAKPEVIDVSTQTEGGDFGRNEPLVKTKSYTYRQYNGFDGATKQDIQTENLDSEEILPEEVFLRRTGQDAYAYNNFREGMNLYREANTELLNGLPGLTQKFRNDNIRKFNEKMVTVFRKLSGIKPCIMLTPSFIFKEKLPRMGTELQKENYIYVDKGIDDNGNQIYYWLITPILFIGLVLDYFTPDAKGYGQDSSTRFALRKKEYKFMQNILDSNDINNFLKEAKQIGIPDLSGGNRALTLSKQDNINFYAQDGKIYQEGKVVYSCPIQYQSKKKAEEDKNEEGNKDEQSIVAQPNVVEDDDEEEPVIPQQTKKTAKQLLEERFTKEINGCRLAKDDNLIIEFNITDLDKIKKLENGYNIVVDLSVALCENGEADDCNEQTPDKKIPVEVKNNDGIYEITFPGVENTKILGKFIDSDNIYICDLNYATQLLQDFQYQANIDNLPSQKKMLYGEMEKLAQRLVKLGKDQKVIMEEIELGLSGGATIEKLNSVIKQLNIDIFIALYEKFIEIPGHSNDVFITKILAEINECNRDGKKCKLTNSDLESAIEDIDQRIEAHEGMLIPQ